MADRDEIDYGPLAGLIGRWRGDEGMDVSPEPDETEYNPYYETLVATGAGDVDNAEEQNLAVVHYQQIVSRRSNNKVFHNESGYWSWDAQRQLVILSLAIPRGVSLVAGGHAREVSGGFEIVVEADLHSSEWPISQSPFMQQKAKTVHFQRTVTIQDGRLTYSQTTDLEIYGHPFAHTDQNSLVPE